MGAVAMGKRLTDDEIQSYVGRVFGKLVVASFAGRVDKDILYACNCSCGTMYVTSRNQLQTGNARSCGCMKREQTIHLNKQRSLPEGEAGFRRLCARYRRSAALRGHAFDLTDDEMRVLFKQDCFYCGLPPEQVAIRSDAGYNGPFIYNGIDRLDSLLGYHLDNVVACCKSCNLAKGTLSKGAFLSLIERIYHHQIKSGT